MKFDRKIEDYDDIIDLSYSGPLRHSKMSRENRAAQFAPFAALTGHSEAVSETARLTEKKILLDENMQDILDFRLGEIMQVEGSADRKVLITYYVPDEKKAGGSYVTATGRILRVDGLRREILLEGGKWIHADDIVWIDFTADY